LAWLLDTDVAIHLRDRSAGIAARVGALDSIPAISVVTLVELQVGAAIDRSTGGLRAPRLAAIRRTLPVLAFGEVEADRYGRIVAALGYDRRRVLDRMIAAQAIVAGRRLITMNGKDFGGIPGLDLEIWPAP
jgi:tRNA(fMet)-specific endonuclease VapC